MKDMSTLDIVIKFLRIEPSSSGGLMKKIYLLAFKSTLGKIKPKI